MDLFVRGVEAENGHGPSLPVGDVCAFPPGGCDGASDHQLGGQGRSFGPVLALQPGEQRPRGLLALAAVWLADRGEAKIGGQPTGVVEADDREVGRDPQTRIGGRLDRALGKPVAQAEQGGRAGFVVQQGGRPGCSVSGGAVRPGPDRDAVPVNAMRAAAAR